MEKEQHLSLEVTAKKYSQSFNNLLTTGICGSNTLSDRLCQKSKIRPGIHWPKK